MGMLAALAGLVFAARFNAASPKAGINHDRLSGAGPVVHHGRYVDIRLEASHHAP